MRLDQPREPGRLRLPRFDPEAFGRWSESDRPVHGYGEVPRLHDRGDRALVRLEHARARRTALRPVHLHVPDPDPVVAGVLRGAADPARAEPAGRPGPARRWRRTGGGRRCRRPTPSTWPARSPRCGSRSARWRPATSSAPSWAGWPRSWTSGAAPAAAGAAADRKDRQQIGRPPADGSRSRRRRWESASDGMAPRASELGAGDSTTPDGSTLAIGPVRRRPTVDLSLTPVPATAIGTVAT